MLLSPTSRKAFLAFIVTGIFLVILFFGTYSTYSKHVRLDIPSSRVGIHLDQSRADAVKEAYRFAFKGYWAACKGQDEIQPVTNTCKNTR